MGKTLKRLTRIQRDPETGDILKAEIVQTVTPGLTPKSRARPSRESALDDAFDAYAIVMKALLKRVEKGDLSAAAELNKAVDTYSKLVRTDILHDKHQDPAEHSEEELKRLIPEAMRVLGGGDIEVE